MQRTVHAQVPEAKLLTDVGTEMTFQLPFSASAKFQGLFEHIDDNETTLGVQSYGVSVTTLEEVFIKVRNDSWMCWETSFLNNIAVVRCVDSSSLRDLLGCAWH
jgi:hypothetical protein